MDIEYIPVIVALSGVCIAVYTDLRRRIISDKLNYSMTAIGLTFYLIFGASKGNLLLAASGAIGAAFSFGIGYALWYTGGWAGGDVKLFTALGALLLGYGMLVGNPLPFPLTILFNSVILLFPVLLVYVLIRRLQGRSALYERVEMDRLREGMIPAETIYEKDGKIYRWGSGFGFKPKWDKRYTNPSRASGLTRYQIGVLRRLARQRKIENFLKIKKGLPFAPAFLVGLATALLFGDIYLRIILWLIGA